MKFQLNSSNYHSPEANQYYMSVSQWKNFVSCEARALAALWGEHKEDKKAFQLGQYVHAWNEGVLDRYTKENKHQIFQKNGKKYEDYIRADRAIKLIEQDPKAMAALKGEKEIVFTGVIAGVPWKMKADVVYSPVRFTDLKYVGDFSPKWDPKDQCRKSFIEYWGYHSQVAVYQEIIRQETGETLEPVILAVTKEKVPDKAIFGYFLDYEMFQALDYIKQTLPRVIAVKTGLEPPIGCGVCDYCKQTKMITGVTKWNEIG